MFRSLNSCKNYSLILLWLQPQTAYDPKTEGGNTSRDATYHALHIRRGDFQYSDTRLSAIEIWNNINHLLDPGKALMYNIDE
jgi:hypothetical protein